MHKNKEILLKYSKLKPNFHIHQLLSMIYEKEGNLFKSLQHINKSIDLNPGEKSLKDARERISLEILKKYLSTKRFLPYFNIVLSNNPCLIMSDDLHILISNLLVKFDNMAKINKYVKLIKINIKKIDRHDISDYKERELLNLMKFYFIVADYKSSFEIMNYLFNNLNSSSLSDFMCPWGDDRKHTRTYLDFHIKQLKKVKLPNSLSKYKFFYLNLIYEYRDGNINTHLLSSLPKKYSKMPLFAYRMVLNYLDKNKISKAYEYMLDIVNIFKNDWYSLCKLGEITICLNKYNEGISYFKKAQGKFKKSIDNVLTWEGEMYLLLGKYKKAISILNKAIALNSTMAYCWRGAAYFKLGDIEKGLRDIQTAVSLSYDYEAMLWYGEIMLAKGNIKEAMKYFDEVLNKHSNYDFAYLNRALVNYKIGDLKGAINDLNKVGNEMRNVVFKSLDIDIHNIQSNEIEKIVVKILDLFKGNRRWENYFLYIVSRG